ncbi:hypothetical protein [Crenobacter cavernae]|uniref:hypothetical protein n=1 Tax=Crenobacter cavernae TaxID=2290923 RepID=UPI0011C07D0F|nr:hypothetical protein [Crenobacter cavernae]
MNRKIILFLRIFFISPEFILLLLPFALYQNEIFLMDWAQQKLAQNGETAKYLGGIPIALLAWTASTGVKIINPGGEKTTTLKEWPEYIEWRITFYVAIIYIFVFCLGGLYFSTAQPVDRFTSSILISSVIGSMLCAGSIFFYSNELDILLSSTNKK